MDKRSRAKDFGLVWRSAVAATVVLTLTLLCAPNGPDAAPPASRSGADPVAIELFEKEIRPLLVGKCQACHDDRKSQGGLRLTSRARLLTGGGSGPAIVPGKPEQSLLIKAVERHGELKMPPDGKLTDAQIQRLKRWITLGAPWPAAAHAASRPGAREAAFRRWWAFQPPRAVPSPAGAAPSAIDRFVRAELKAHGLSPATHADRRTLIRRLTLDLTGLPPTPEAVAEFERDCELEGGQGSGVGVQEKGAGSRPLGPSPAPGPRPPTPSAYARLVDRLLAAPAYGERYARHWLDVVRYADYHDGNPQARTASCEPLNAWRYRDWVVGALNRDLPFDQFITHQIAGDLLPSPDGQEFYADGLVATTFLTNGSWDRGDADKEKMVSDMVDDQVDTVGKAFLGLTLGCARCHDHKFDPVSQADYYALAGIFYSTHILADIGAKGGEYTLNRVPLAPKSYVTKRDQQLQQLNELTARLAELDKKSPKPPADDPGRLMLVQQRDRLQSEVLPEPPLAEAAQEGGSAKGLFPGIQDVPIHIRGSYTRLGEVVPRRMPAFFAGSAQPRITNGSGRRELAAWVASKSNPLTARVIVNRVWQWHFGQGLVDTPSNLGKMGGRPSNPELLDWLAVTFMSTGQRGNGSMTQTGNGSMGQRVSGTTKGRPGAAARTPAGAPTKAPLTALSHAPIDPSGFGWSLKALHRLIMSSAAYQRGGEHPYETKAAKLDPDCRLLSRFPPRRLEAEELRDSVLAVAGELSLDAGGPGVYPEINEDLALQPRHVMGTIAPAWEPSPTRAERNRRTIYTYQQRSLINPLVEVFNGANPNDSCERRLSSTVAPQVFSLFNSRFSHDAALAFAARIAKAERDPGRQVRLAFRLALQRAPTASEQRASRSQLDAMLRHHRAHPPAPPQPPARLARRAVVEQTGETVEIEEGTEREGYEPNLHPSQVDAETRALAELCLVLLNTSEFAYVY